MNSNNMNKKMSFKELVREYWLKTSQGSIPYGIGCAWLGRVDNYMEMMDEYVHTLKRAYNLGFRYFDTSAAYGESELTVGEFVKEVPRDSVFLASKSRVPFEEDPVKAADFVKKGLERSLKRMNTSYLDLFQLHDVDTLSHVLVENGVIDVLLEAKKQGLIRYFGLATRSHNLLEQAARHGAFDTILTYSDYTPIDQSAKWVIDCATDLGVGVINASPLSAGWLTGKNPRERDAENHPESIWRKKIATVFYDFCTKKGVSVLAAALQFPLKNGNIDITLTGPATADEVNSSWNALNTPIPDEFWMEWNEVMDYVRTEGRVCGDDNTL